jgi:23S rRNA pseudouridine1911/1915/1917 synthase
MHRGGFSKQYLAILEGVPDNAEGEINACLHRTAKSVILREVCSPYTPDAEPSITRYRVLFSDGDHSVVLASPITGRTHQLRVHFASIGAPILGDDLYGRVSEIIPRHALHAVALNFAHPITNEDIHIRSPLPEDMRVSILSLFGDEDASEILSLIENELL